MSSPLAPTRLIPRLAISLISVCFALLAIAQEKPATISTAIDVHPSDLLAQPVSANWISYNGDYSGRRFSNLAEITPENVDRLRAQWIFHIRDTTGLEVTPVVVNGIMFVTSANDAFALDARTGRAVWHHQRPASSGLLGDAASHHDRGVAVWRTFLYLRSGQAQLLCLDARFRTLHLLSQL